MRGHDFTLSAAARRAAFLIGSTRRSAHSYCVASSATPANIASKPGPGSTSAAIPTRISSQPAPSTTTRFAVLFTVFTILVRNGRADRLVPWYEAGRSQSSSSELTSSCVPGRGAHGSSLEGRTTISSSPRASSDTVGSK